LILNSEEFFRETESTLRRVAEFIGIEPSFRIKNLKPLNVGKNRTDVEPQIRDELSQYFQPLNEQLFDLLGERFDW